MTIELKPEHQRMIDSVIRSGAYIPEARRHEPRSTLDDVEAELRALGKLK